MKTPTFKGWLLLAAALFGAATAQAKTFDIKNGDVARLIAAINTSNTNKENDVINLATNGTYKLVVANNPGNGLPVIGSNGGRGIL